MKTLPPVTRPPLNRVKRRHSPRKVTGKHGYRVYRPCLRWDFGFSCAFCLLHESDFVAHGAERLGLTWIEHIQLISTDPDHSNDYTNCFYSCRLCNRKRSAIPIVSEHGERLLNPCQYVWADYFEAQGDRLQPRSGDMNAQYTYETYGFDDKLKVEMRKARREALTICRALFDDGFSKIQRLIDLGDPESLEAAQELGKCIRLAASALERYAAVPKDAGNKCRCQTVQHHALPEWLSDQTFAVPI